MTTANARTWPAPAFLYGTAWKEERTEELTAMALAAGFRAVDTANQRKHYDEASAGAGIAQSGIPRGALFLQTKFTYARGQDHRLPYDPSAPIATQVRQSFESSLLHLRTDYVDSYVLHGPWAASGWSAQDDEAWSAMEQLFQEGRAHRLGVSNVSKEQLAALCASVRVQPAFVQNRCHARTGWDKAVRAYAAERGVVYQGFSLLTANTREMDSPLARRIASRLRATVPQVVFRFARAVGMLPLTGTSDRTHATQDLASLDLELTSEDVAAIEMVSARPQV